MLLHLTKLKRIANFVVKAQALRKFASRYRKTIGKLAKARFGRLGLLEEVKQEKEEH